MRPTDLKVSLDLISIHTEGELEKKFVTTVYMMLKWRDEFLLGSRQSFPFTDLLFLKTSVETELCLNEWFHTLKKLGVSFYNVVLATDGTVT